MINNKAYTEIVVIINNMSAKLREKIPLDLIESFKQNMDKNYCFLLASNIKDTKLLEDTEKLLSLLYTDYFASEEEKIIINAKERSLILKAEKEKRKYGNSVV